MTATLPLQRIRVVIKRDICFDGSYLSDLIEEIKSYLDSHPNSFLELVEDTRDTYELIEYREETVEEYRKRLERLEELEENKLRADRKEYERLRKIFEK